MFPMCHIYFSDRVTGNLSDFAVLGSIYPDIVIANILNRDTTHYNTNSLYNHFKLKDNKMEEFTIGAITHGVDMMGLDFYSDENYGQYNKGYCFERGIEIAKDVIECCNIPDEWGLWKAHNFIEMAFDLYLCKYNPWIPDMFKSALENEYIVKHVSKNLGLFYSIPALAFEESFKKFGEFVQYDNIDEFSVIQKYAVQLNKKHGIKNINISKGARVILKAVEIVSNDINNFFDYTVFKVKEVVNSLT